MRWLLALEYHAGFNLKNHRYRLFQDWAANRGNFKSQLVMFLFRMAHYSGRWPKPMSVLSNAYLFLYRFFTEWLLGIEIPWQAQIGENLRIFHGYSLVIHYQSIIGRDCVLRQSTTIGTGTRPGAPIIGDRVDIGANVCIIGDITIGNDVVIGAGSVVIKSVPAHAVVAGNPARVIRINPAFKSESLLS